MSSAHCQGAPTTGCSCFSRRDLLRSTALAGGSVAAAALLTGCGGSEEPAGDAAEPSSGALGPASEVPVGSAVIFADQQVVVAQPAAGEYVAFSATCTHQGCQVSEVSGKEIICTCHGSHFSIEDGSVLSGPASEPLASEKVTVESDQLVLG
jgi:Rieske Fe-S protein